MGTGAIAAPPRRIEALAYIMERIARSGTSPSYGEIGGALRPVVGSSRARQYVDELVKIGAIERPVASRRGIRIRNLQLCRSLVDQAAANRWGHRFTPQLGILQDSPCTNEQLPLIRLALHQREAD